MSIDVTKIIRRAARQVMLLAVCVMTLGASQLANAGALSDLASSMQAGTFAELTSMNGWSSGSVLVPSQFGCSSGDYVTTYADKAAWDPVHDQLLFVGQTHGNCYAGLFMVYSEQSNTWSYGPYPPVGCQSGTPTNPCFSHGYDHSTVDPATGDFYYRHYNSTKVYRYRGGSWSAIAPIALSDVQCCGALEYFPDMGRLIFVDGDWGVMAYNPSTNAWTRVANGNVNVTSTLAVLTMSSYNNFAVYNPVAKVVLFGGGKNLYRLNANGTVTTMNAPPVTLGVTNTTVSYDPVSGAYLVLADSGLYQYDVTSDTWTKLTVTVPTALNAMLGVGDGLVAATIRELGVVMYTKYNYGSSKVYLYKHSPYKAIKPNPPTGVVVR